MLAQAAVADFRAKVLAPFFAEIAKQSKYWGRTIEFDMASYIKRLDKLASTQLQYTLENLPPADSVGLFKVTYKSSSPAASTAGAPKPSAGIVDEKAKANTTKP